MYERLGGDFVFIQTEPMEEERVRMGWAVDARTNRLVLMSAEDNVIKGAGGQGVHAFNIMFGFDETEGLWLI